MKKRRVFFSFHYQNDIWRACQVRNSWRFHKESEREAEGFFDSGIWEKFRRENVNSLKNLIREGLKNTSVTCILVGEQTYIRRWVRFEIAQSVIKGNGLLVVKIHDQKDHDGNYSKEGPNPLNYMGLCRANNGEVFLVENKSRNWVLFHDHKNSVVLPKYCRRNYLIPGLTVPLSEYFEKQYYYSIQDGYNNFARWVQESADLAEID